MKICTDLYGGKPLFGGKEQPLEADEIYCDCANRCTLYAQGKCLCCRAFLSRRCPNGRVVTTQGYTTRAKKYSAFRQKYVNDVTYGKLNYPNSDCFAIVGDMYWFRLKHVTVKKADKTESANCANGYVVNQAANRDSYIPVNETTPALLHQIFTYRPVTFYDHKEITAYRTEVVPNIVYAIKKTAPMLYTWLVEYCPEYASNAYTPNYIGMYAYTRTLSNGSILTDCHGNRGVLKDGKIYCDSFVKGHVPFDGKSATVVVEVSDTATYKITDNAQVDENTKFK